MTRNDTGRGPRSADGGRPANNVSDGGRHTCEGPRSGRSGRGVAGDGSPSQYLTDGGRRTPGVPDDVDDSAEGTDDGVGTHREGETDTTAASERPMPGVPRVEGDEGEQSKTAGADGGGGRATGESHDGDAEHGLTTAITLRALKRTRSPAAVVADANTWSDWVGVVGEASGPELNAFFRQHSMDVDFFNDVSDGPAERLAGIDEGHHFNAERRVLVGLPDERAWAETAGWEFQSFEETAESAGWALEDA